MNFFFVRSPLRPWGAFFLIASITCGSLAHAFGPARPPAVPPNPSSDSASNGSSEPLVITPETLRETLFNRNLSVRESVLQKWTAKADLSVTRARLFPSVDLNSVISANPIFSSIRVVLPFFLPSNWFRASSAKALYDFNRIGTRIVKLNEFARAYSLYFTILSDLQSKSEFEKQAADLQKIVDTLEADLRHFGPGTVPVEVLAKARDQAAFAAIAASEARVICETEKEQLRDYLNLPLNQQFSFAPATLPPSPMEDEDPAKVLLEAHARAPEVQQLEELEKAQKRNLGSVLFNWIGGASVLGTPQEANPSDPFGRLQATASGTLGPVTYFEYKRAQLNVESVKLQKEQFLNRETHGVALVFAALKEAKLQAEQAKIAEENSKIAYDAIHKEYLEGSRDIEVLMLSHHDLATAVGLRLAKDLRLTLLRVTLHRMLLSESFATIAADED